jgi:hypothetical protein
MQSDGSLTFSQEITKIRNALCDEESLQTGLIFLKNVFKWNDYNDQQIHRVLNHCPPISANWTTNPTQSLSCLLSGLFSTESAVLARQICGLAPREIIQSPLACQKQPRTKNTRCLQDPLWVWQGLRWADGSFRGHQVKGASMAHKTRTSRQVGHSWTFSSTMLLPSSPHKPDTWTALLGRLWYWTPPIQYEQRGQFLSQQNMEVAYLLPKNFWDMALGPLDYAVLTLWIALAQKWLKPSTQRLLIPHPLVVLSFNIPPKYNHTILRQIPAEISAT